MRQNKKRHQTKEERVDETGRGEIRPNEIKFKKKEVKEKKRTEMRKMRKD